jgi:hypothetical protein
MKFALQLEAFQIVDEALVRLPGQLIDLVLKNRHPFGKVFFGDVVFFLHLAGFQFDFAQARRAVMPRAFV